MDSLSRRSLLVLLLLVLNTFFFFYRPPRQQNSAPIFPGSSLIDRDPFSQFEGYEECGITVSYLYERPPSVPYCPIRSTLLNAMSEGGRHGFDTPFVGKGIQLGPLL